MPLFLYTYARHDDEQLLCGLELRSLFGFDPQAHAFIAEGKVDVSRSPFIKERIDLRYEGHHPHELAKQVQSLDLHGATFKIVFVKTGEDVAFEERREVTREVGLHVRGKAEMRTPQIIFGVAKLGDRWVFGEYHSNQAIWLKHNDKAQHYSTALSTRIARAVTNIAVPDPLGMKVIDPCCGIGTVVIEALSMGMDIVGYDINWMAVHGARTNLKHFGLPDVVKMADMRQLNGHYDTAILDLPYNLCSKLSQEEQEQLLQSARRLAKKVVVISIEAVDEVIERVGFKIVDRCMIKKGTFTRELLVCT